MIEKPLVTVISPVYNTGKYFLRGVKSLQNQTFDQGLIQHIIVDDGSTDDSVKLIEKFIEQENYKCTFIKNPKNEGLCKTLNKGLSLAMGKYVAYLPDDMWKPNKLAEEVKLFEKLPDDYGVIYTNVDFCDENDAVFKENVKHQYAGINGNVHEHLIKNKNFIFGSAVLIKRSVFDKHGYYDESLPFEDTAFWLKISKTVLFQHLDKPNVIYRRLSDHSNLSMVLVKNSRIKIEDSIILLRHLIDANDHKSLIADKVISNLTEYCLQNNIALFQNHFDNEADLFHLAEVKKQKKIHLVLFIKNFFKRKNKRFSFRDMFYFARKSM